MGRSAVVCAALGVWWWATVRLVWQGIGCGDWGCLAPALGVVVVITLALVAGSAFALERAGVRPGRRVALVAAGALVVFRVAGDALPSWTSTLAHALAAGAAFAGAGGVAAFCTEPEVARRWKVVAALGLVALVPLAVALSWARFGG
ncbi:hypothetical protein FH608_032770 [Nonomuraea phyllanthi]|uniref:Uncharacterized protein n=1 Tax=Nonomuraea phyllanthi TaxID=2219224 RepID=A0A5C4W1W9_9ACTN|nr:hypothetical protein [Nonomuraea phyllanthi]KAB8190838.1 hypothetical protein FH608_032770 [Nonomuraea phyllanthi]